MHFFKRCVTLRIQQADAIERQRMNVKPAPTTCLEELPITEQAAHWFRVMCEPTQDLQTRVEFLAWVMACPSRMGELLVAASLHVQAAVLADCQAIPDFMVLWKRIVPSHVELFRLLTQATLEHESTRLM